MKFNGLALLSAIPKRISTSTQAFIAMAICLSMTFCLMGCTPAQQTDFKAAVAKIAQYEPAEVDLAVDTLTSTISVFLPADAALITATQTAFDTAAAELKTLCATYAATPNAGTLASIQTTLNTMLSTNADPSSWLPARSPIRRAVAEAKIALGCRGRHRACLWRNGGDEIHPDVSADHQSRA